MRPSLVRAANGTAPRRHSLTPTYCYLLDVDADLADEFDLRMRIVARQVATAEVIELDARPCDLWAEAMYDGAGPGLLVLDGVLAVEVSVGDRTATELVGAGDLLQPRGTGADDLVEHEATWQPLLPARIAVLDSAFAERVRPWPQIGQALLRRAARRIANIGVQRAIACQPRLEVRLDLMLWHYAGRFGRVEPGGIRLSLPLTHRLLGRLVGAERPSVTHALARLSTAGLVTGGASELHLHGTLDEHMASLSGRS